MSNIVNGTGRGVKHPEIKIIIFSSSGANAGKDTAANFITDLIKDSYEISKVPYNLKKFEFACAPKMAYMDIHNEHDFYFYKTNPDLRSKLNDFSNVFKQEDHLFWTRKTYSAISSYLDTAYGRDTYIIIPDMRYAYELEYLPELLLDPISNIFVQYPKVFI